MQDRLWRQPQTDMLDPLRSVCHLVSLPLGPYWQRLALSVFYRTRCRPGLQRQRHPPSWLPEQPQISRLSQRLCESQAHRGVLPSGCNPYRRPTRARFLRRWQFLPPRYTRPLCRPYVWTSPHYHLTLNFRVYGRGHLSFCWRLSAFPCPATARPCACRSAGQTGLVPCSVPLLAVHGASSTSERPGQPTQHLMVPSHRPSSCCIHRRANSARVRQ